MSSLDPDTLRTDVLDLLGAAPPPDPSPGYGLRARDLARRVADRAGMLLPAGARVGPYTIQSVLGRGGQATVYRAVDESGRVLALKVPRAELVSRLVREAQILFHLDHPRIVRIERAEILADVPYLACELLPGGTLAERLRQGPLPPADVARLADHVLEALAHGHQKGVVHRDIKPSNVLFDAEGQVKVADFGIGSLALVEELGLPQTLVSLDHTLGAGTPVYMAPEQEDPGLRVDGKVDGRADLYSLGKLLYAALTGRSPRTVLPVSSLVPEAGVGWDRFLFRLLEDRPADRFPSAEAARQDLRSWRDLPVSPTPVLPASSRRDHGGTPAMVASACHELSRKGAGALIAIERGDSLGGRARMGSRLDAMLSELLLLSVFAPESPLRDGAVVVRGGRLEAAGCFLPNAEAAQHPGLGTRHLAALGQSEESDAVVVVVSEETGAISLAVEGELRAGLTPLELARELRALLETQSVPRLIHSEDGPLERVNRLLEELALRSGARCSLLVDARGHPIAQVGSSGVHTDTIAALVAASYAATREVAKVLGDPCFLRLTHEGAQQGLVVCLVDERTLLASFVDADAASHVEWALAHAQETAAELARILDRLEDDPHPLDP